MLAEPVERQVGERGDDKEGGEEDESLNPAAGGDAFGPGFEAGRGAGGKQKPENGDAPEPADDVHDVANAAEGDGFGELAGRERVGVLRIGGGWGRGGLGYHNAWRNLRPRSDARGHAGEQDGKADR